MSVGGRRGRQRQELTELPMSLDFFESRDNMYLCIELF